MALPTENAVLPVLIRLLSRLGGRAAPRDLYGPIAEAFPEITPEDLLEKQPSGPNKWQNIVQWARWKLVEAGVIDKSTYGVWQLTPHGMELAALDEIPTNALTRKVELSEETSEYGGVETVANRVRSVWIEKTRVRGRPDRATGEHALGLALWSPERSGDERDIYHFMRDVEPSDVILHFTDNEAFTGVSEAAGRFEPFRGVAGTQWGDRPAYRVPLRDFRRIDPPLERSYLFEGSFRERLAALIDAGERDLFYERRGDALAVHEGGYLTPASPALFEILDDAYRARAGHGLIEPQLPAHPRDTPAGQRLLVAGTFDADVTAKQIEEFLLDGGQGAFWWSHPLPGDKREVVDEWPYLYVYHSRQPHQLVTLRYHVVAVATTADVDGMQTPWPSATRTEWTGQSRIGPQKSQAFRTWFLVDSVERLDPPIAVSELERADGSPAHPNQLLGGFGVWRLRAPDATLSGPHRPELSLEWLCEETLWPQAAMQELLDTVNRPGGGQIIFAGPPGTGKTWVALAVARFLTNDDPEAFRVVQFHPSYSYEEFIEGLRPVSVKGAISFEVVPGTVLRMVAEMASADDRRVLVVDEMNRANLPRVFGELLFLMEYRNQTVDLQYSSGFQLPPGLKFLATMNTADRSIRSIDAAMRRRFAVFECPPDASILEQYYTERTNDVPDLVSGFLALNERLTTAIDRHHTVGHTFFMNDEGMTHALLRQAWVHQIRPLLDEYFFDQPDLADQFTIEQFWPSLA